MDKAILESELKVKDLKTVGFSIDKVCQLFFYEDRVFRAINTPYEAQVQEMFSCGMIQELIDKNLLINSWITDVKIEGFNLVVEHQRVSFWNYPYEWSFSMLKDAANTVLTISEIAQSYNFELFDVHSHNVVFDMGTPKFIDLGSFFRKDPNDGKSWTGYLSFYNAFYIPTYLYTKGYSDLPQSIQLFHGYYNEKDFFNLRFKYATFFGSWLSNLVFKFYFNARKLANARHFRVVEKFGKHKYSQYILFFKNNFQNIFSIKKARRLMKGLKNSKFDSYWMNYHNEIDPATNKRFQRITELFNTDLKDAKSLIELASNQGKFANHLLANSQIDKVIATDYDKNAVDAIYKNNKGSDNVLPLVYDFVRPNGRITDTRIQDRIKADVVMALAVTHHLILTQEIGLKHIFSILESLSDTYVVVEFMPLGLYAGDLKTTPPVPDFYTLAWFKEAFSAHFDYHLDEELEINRHLFIGKVKKS
ncbi:hypothetical protein [Altibacter sp.]|uniref:hypothetical protein n=1 Tax=Altibacter sp. TaxID=2024823 RepID=UPI000C8EC0DE|nr:hypothetical protein [Altibacter sp.]MAP54382.1 hypothetical protein [Altibacter sp.]